MKYEGSCQCGAVKYELETDVIKSGMECNCSRCYRMGWALAFVPEAQFTQKSGEDNLTEYLFNKKQIRHLFCKTCGVQSFGKGSDDNGNVMVAVNLRCVKDFDLSAIEINQYNGKDF
jgi:hypothetical protein